MPTIMERIAAFVKAADAQAVERFKAMEITGYPAPTHQAEYISAKWCRIHTVNSDGRNEGVFAFVCLEDGFTKKHGVLKAGDIHKPDSWKVAAKHARGNVFLEDFGQPFAQGGVRYLR